MDFTRTNCIVVFTTPLVFLTVLEEKHCSFFSPVLFNKFKPALNLTFPFCQADQTKVEVFTLLSFLQDQIAGPHPIQPTTYQHQLLALNFELEEKD